MVDEKGGTGFVKDASGQFVKSHLDDSMLKQIAEATGAMYQPLGQQAQGLDVIYRDGLAGFARRELASRMHKVYIERYQWPLALGLLCLLLDPLVGIRRRRTVKKPAKVASSPLFASWNRRARPARALAAASAALTILGLAQAAHASARAGEKAFQKGDYTKAEQEYRQAAAGSPDKPALQFNHGAAAYKSGNYDAAAQSFAKAVQTDVPKLQQDDYYNLGNTQYRIGQKTGKANPPETIKHWEQAVQSYETALQLKSDDADAKYNRDLVKRRLEELKKQQQQQQQQDQDKNQQNKDQKDKNDKKDPQNGGSGQDKKDQKNQDKQQNPQPNKDQGKPDQQQKSSSGQDQNKPDQKKDSPDKQNGGSGEQPKPDQPNQKPETKNQDGQANQKPDPAKKDGQPQARNPQPKDAGQDPADAQREPGQMSREEARQLLDSLKSGDRKMPLEPSARGTAGVRNDEPLKDW